MALMRVTAAARVIQPRSTATMMHIRPKPVPPMATLSSSRCLARGAPVGRQAADRVAAFPEEAEGLPLHLLEQLVIGQRGQLGRAQRARAACGVAGG